MADDLTLPRVFWHDLSLAQDARTLYNETGIAVYLDASVAAWDRILGHSDFKASAREFRALVWNNGGGTRLMRYEIGGSIEDLNRSLECLTQGVELTRSNSRDLPARLSNLGIALKHQYLHTGNLVSLERAIEAWEQAVSKDPCSPQTPFSELGLGLYHYYLHTGDSATLWRSVQLCEESVRHVPPESPKLPSRLNNWALGLKELYVETGNLDHLDKAIDCWKQAIAQTPQQAANLPRFLNNLGIGLQAYYSRTGNLSILDEAIETYERAVELTPRKSLDLVRHLGNLASAFADRYHRTRRVEDLERSIQCFEVSLRESPTGSTEVPMQLNNLSSALQDRHRRTQNPEDLQRAVELAEQAVVLCHPDSPEFSLFQGNLGNALDDQYLRSEDPAVLEKAIRAYSLAAMKTPSGSAYLPRYLGNLGAALSRRYDRGDSADKKPIIDNWESAAKLGLNVALHAALNSGINWGNWSFKHRDWGEAVRGYAFAWEASERLFQTQFARSNKASWLRETQGLPARYAFAKAKTGDLREAVLDLENGSARLLAEAFERSRADLEVLRAADANLYDSYIQAVERITALDRSEVTSRNSSAIELTSKRQAAQAELDEVIRSIRRLSGHEEFLSKATFNDIQRACSELAGSGALVYLATTLFGSVCLIVTGSTVDVVWSEFSASDLDSIMFTLKGDTVTGGYLPGQLVPVAMKQALTHLLPSVGDRLILPLATRLHEMGIEHIALIPIGRLSLLPLHACSYSVNEARKCFLEDFIVSYAPNARFLTAAQRRLLQESELSLVGVGNPLPNDKPIWASEAELREIATMFPANATWTRFAEAASKKALLAELPKAKYLHFACHGVFNPHDPLRSRLELSGDDVLTLKDLLNGEMRLVNARLVVLSACQSAMTDFVDLPDEFIGMSAGFLQAGAAGVVGTLWPVDDFSTALVMIRFYEFHLGTPADAKDKSLPPAEALKQAQQWLRQITNEELASYLGAHPKLKESLHVAATVLQKETILAGVLRPSSKNLGARPFADNPYYWAPFVFIGV